MTWKPGTPLQAVFFDIDDTLYSTSEFARRARANAIRAMIRMGLKVTLEQGLHELDEVVAEFTSNYPNHYDKLLSRLPREAWEGTNPAVLVASGVVAYHQTKFAELFPYPDVVEVLKLLARTRLVRGIITAGITVKQAEKVVRLRIYDFLTPNAIFISDQIGISKPNPKLYVRACADTGVSPEASMYIGDNPRFDIDPPNRIGMITVRNRRSGKFRDQEGETKPDFEINSFWDLLAVLREKFDVKV
ncbi:MAG: TIGR02253 family HAD-type hydrolase [Planctomycetes bacterium]|nr:TIGR02253 family HAD-type hydrolase [Planctomycetota bacterium]